MAIPDQIRDAADLFVDQPDLYSQGTLTPYAEAGLLCLAASSGGGGGGAGGGGASVTDLIFALENAENLEDLEIHLLSIISQLTSLGSVLAGQKDFNELIVLDNSDGQQYVRQRTVNEDGTAGTVAFYDFDGNVANPQPNPLDITAVETTGSGGSGGGITGAEVQAAIEAAANLDDLEQSLVSLLGLVTTLNNDVSTSAKQDLQTAALNSILGEVSSLLDATELQNALDASLVTLEATTDDILTELETANATLAGIQTNTSNSSSSTSDTTAANQTAIIAAINDLTVELEGKPDLGEAQTVDLGTQLDALELTTTAIVDVLEDVQPFYRRQLAVTSTLTSYLDITALTLDSPLTEANYSFSLDIDIPSAGDTIQVQVLSVLAGQNVQLSDDLIFTDSMVFELHGSCICDSVYIVNSRNTPANSASINVSAIANYTSSNPA